MSTIRFQALKASTRKPIKFEESGENQRFSLPNVFND
jgi:hypothetical protein